MDYRVVAERIDALGCIAACMIEGIERVTPILVFDLRGAEVRFTAVRRDSPPRRRPGGLSEPQNA